MELKFDPENPDYTYITNIDEANKALEKLEKERVVGVDIESTGLDPYFSTMLTVQIGTDKKSYVFDARQLKLNEIKRFKHTMDCSHGRVDNGGNNPSGEKISYKHINRM